jgi:hypothetical protein
MAVRVTTCVNARTRHRLLLSLPQNSSFDTTANGVTSTLAIRDAEVGIPID